MKRQDHLCAIRVSVLGLALLACELGAGQDRGVGAAVENALLAEDWRGVAESSDSYEALAASPALRAVRAHSLMMINRNNASLTLFLSLAGTAEREAWLHWTERLVGRYPRAPVTYYLNGDALARAGRWVQARRSYAIALGAESPRVKALKDTAPAYIGDGVARTHEGRLTEARVAFEKAIEANGTLAEAYASLGNLQLLRQAPKGARKSYRQALSLSPEYVLALNGLACAQYGLGEWVEASEGFVKAAEQVPLALFAGNLRALNVTAENLQSTEPSDSPLFRFTDFLDWAALRAETVKRDDILRTLLGRSLLAELDDSVLEALNARLGEVSFYGRIESRIRCADAVDDVRDAGVRTQHLRTRGDPLSVPELDAVQWLNRRVLECTYPALIAKHTERDPGMQLTLTRGLLDQQRYKNSLTPGQIATGQWNMDHLGRPLADALRSSQIPVLVFMGRQLNRHLDFSTQTNRLALQKRGIKLDSVRPGGVSTDLRHAFNDQGEWPVVNWFGLVQTTEWFSRDRVVEEERR